MYYGGMVTCIHCNLRKAVRARGLCNKCYAVPAIQRQYPLEERVSKYHGPNDFYGRLPCPEIATTTLPGTEERIRAMAEREAAGLSLYHPNDAVRDVG